MTRPVRWEQRWHPLREEWVIIAAHRQDRPWHGERVEAPARSLPAHEGACFFCPGNRRVGGARNPDYTSVFVFDNDHPCVGGDAPQDLADPPGIYRSRPATGLARVVCYSPLHHMTLAELPLEVVERVIITWRDQSAELGARPEVNQVLAFENKGEVVGVSNPHPHGQIYATNFIWKTIEVEAAAARRHLEAHGRVLFQDIIHAEQIDGRRIIVENDTAIAFMPWFARYAYECYVAPKASHASLSTLSATEVLDLAAALKGLLVRYDNLWRMPFPYVMVVHQAPSDGREHPGFHMHLQLHPPLRKPHLLKYLAGPEIGGGNFLSDTLPEEKAAELRAASGTHYTHDA